MQEQEH